MAHSKRCPMGGGEGRCAIHRATPQEKWLRTRDVAQDIASNLKEAIKVLQDENTSVMAAGPSALQATESRRKAALKKALNRLGRAFNQVSTVESYEADLNGEIHNLQKKLEASEKFQMELSAQMEASTSTMQEQTKYYKNKMQEADDRLHSQEKCMASMRKELEAAKISADLARKEKLAVEEPRETEQGHGPERHLKSAAFEEDSLRAENEILKKLYSTALKEKEAFDTSNEEALKNASLAAANVERYKEVVAKLTADNMVFLMKLKHREAALGSAQGKLGELQKEVESGRAQWLDEASAEIQEVVRSSFSKAETFEAKLLVLQSRQAKIDEEWEEKLMAATEKLAHITSAKDWLEKSLMEATEKCKALEDEKSKLLQRYETECQHRQHAESESRALICTLRKTNEELADVNLELGASIKETENQRNCVLEHKSKIEKLLADLDKANCQLETQQAINAALMKRKEEVEWELMAAEAHRARLHQNLTERLSKSCGTGSPLASFVLATGFAERQQLPVDLPKCKKWRLQQ